MFFKKCLAALVAVVALGVATPSVHAQQLKSPDDVKKALQIVMHVTNDFDRQITRKTFARIPHENEEFGEASAALQKSVAGEPDAFKQKVDAALKDAKAAAQATADKSGSNDEAVLRASHTEMVKKVNVVMALFPEPMRPPADFMMTRPAAAPAAK